MTGAELDSLWRNAARNVVSAEIATAPGPSSGGVFDQLPRVMATLDDGRGIELSSYDDRRNRQAVSR